MRREALQILAAPDTGAPLTLEPGLEYSGELVEGRLLEPSSGRRWVISRAIPRFVEQDGYAASFGEQWHRYRCAQIDRFNGTTLSHDRLFKGTGWRAEELRGQRVLEIGCGAGRFTQVLLDAGAEVYALDASRAIDACWHNHAPHPALTLVQADVYHLPFQRDAFDKVLCYGMLQHTPDVKRAFMSMVPFLKPGGGLAIDVYNKFSGRQRINRWTAKYWWRPLTSRLSPAQLARFVEWYVPLWLPIDTLLARVPTLGRYLVSIVPCWNYSGRLPLSAPQLKEWAVLDTFDALSACYDSPQRIEDVQAWFAEAGLESVEVRFGGNGIIGNGRRAMGEAHASAHVLPGVEGERC